MFVDDQVRNFFVGEYKAKHLSDMLEALSGVEPVTMVMDIDSVGEFMRTHGEVWSWSHKARKI